MQGKTNPYQMTGKNEECLKTLHRLRMGLMG